MSSPEPILIMTITPSDNISVHIQCYGDSTCIKLYGNDVLKRLIKFIKFIKVKILTVPEFTIPFCDVQRHGGVCFSNTANDELSTAVKDNRLMSFPCVMALYLRCRKIPWGVEWWKQQSSASLAFVRGIHRDRWIPRTKASNAENYSIWWRHHV